MSGITETSREIVSRSGSNLAFALAVLPSEKRADMAVFYAFCRVVDDIADDPGIPLPDRVTMLDRWKRLISGEIDGAEGIESEFLELRNKYQLDRNLLGQIVDGVAMDLEPGRFQKYEDLLDYCYHVASAVGLVSIEIFGYRCESTKIYAEKLGYALQWTNIMRDVGEDAGELRIYLPLEDLDEFGIGETEILERRAGVENFRALMEKQSHIARGFYRDALVALDSRDRTAMRSPELMRRIYSGILDKMERDNYRVFEKRYRLSKVRMLAEFIRARTVG